MLVEVNAQVSAFETLSLPARRKDARCRGHFVQYLCVVIFCRVLNEFAKLASHFLVEQVRGMQSLQESIEAKFSGQVWEYQKPDPRNERRITVLELPFLTELPQTFVISLERFGLDFMTLHVKKWNDRVEIPETID